MALFAVTFVVIGLAVAGLSLGVLLGRAPIKGSCGGAGAACGACAQPCGRRASRDSEPPG